MLANFVSLEDNEFTRGFVLASLSHIAYDVDAIRRRRRFLNLGFEEIAAVECESAGLTGLEGYVLRYEAQTVLAFRGSQEFRDFLTDLDLTKAPVSDIFVHRGFARSAIRFVQAFEANRVSYGDISNVWITGHSLGGAISQIVGYLLHQAGVNVVNVTTFGGLRVGGKVFWKNRIEDTGLSVQFERWVNDRDIGPRIPVIGLQPQNWIWVHVGRLHTITKETRSIHLDDPSRVWPGRAIDSFDDHSISGFTEGDSSGYMFNILEFMPSAERRRLQQGASGLMKDALLMQHDIYGYEEVQRLSSLAVGQMADSSLRQALLRYS